MTARNWWLRSPNPSNCNNVRNVNSSGVLNNNNANNTYGELDDCGTASSSTLCKKTGSESRALTHRELLPWQLAEIMPLTDITG